MRNPIRPQSTFVSLSILNIHQSLTMSGLRIRPKGATRTPTTCSRTPCSWNERILQ
ncbi:hypothetical protein BDM02DRAFT_3123588, partial [Thelephora ganbajun]